MDYSNMKLNYKINCRFRGAIGNIVTNAVKNEEYYDFSYKILI